MSRWTIESEGEPKAFDEKPEEGPCCMTFISVLGAKEIFFQICHYLWNTVQNSFYRTHKNVFVSLKNMQTHFQIVTFLKDCWVTVFLDSNEFTSLLRIFDVQLSPSSQHWLLPLSLKLSVPCWITVVGLGFGKVEVVKTSVRGEGNTSKQFLTG